MRKAITCGIDIGTHKVRAIVLGASKKDESWQIIAKSEVPNTGMHMGYIQNLDHVIRAVKKAKSEVENMCNMKIKRANVSIGGVGLSCQMANGSAIVSRADKEVTMLDIQKSQTEAEEALNMTNKKLLQVIPVEYKLDGKEIHGRPEGMNGVKLESKNLFITINKQHLEDLVSAVSENEIHIDNIIPEIVAEGSLLLSDRQKMVGCALLNIGFEVCTMAVYENGTLVHIAVIPVGGLDITKDIALGFKISLDDAESIKVGTVIGDFPKKKLDEIIEARLDDIFELVEAQLKKIKKNGLLPAGVVITGGGAHIPNIESIAKGYLKLPTKVGYQSEQNLAKYKLKDENWYGALGLALYQKDFTDVNLGGVLNENFGDVKKIFKSWLSQLLP